MLLKVKTPLLDLDGNPVMQPPAREGELAKEFTLAAAIEGALLSPQEGDDKNPKGSFDRFMLAMKLHEAKGTVELTIDEAKLIKDRVAKAYSALVMGRVWQALEAAPNKPAIAAE